jgi:hypothetical protein
VRAQREREASIRTALGLTSAVIYMGITFVIAIVYLVPSSPSGWTIVATSAIPLLPAALPWLAYPYLIRRGRRQRGFLG